MDNLSISQASRSRLIKELKEAIRTSTARKALEYGSGICSVAAEIRDALDYLACTDRPEELSKVFRTDAEAREIYLIPDTELGEDCYFGRFHLVYTNFAFRGRSHLVDEVMRLRRLILKGGKIVIIDFAADGFDTECIKQLKRCGFADPRMRTLDLAEGTAFMITAQK